VGSYLTLPVTLPPLEVKVNVEVLIVAGFMALLKTAVTTALGHIPEDPFGGSTDGASTVGAAKGEPGFPTPAFLSESPHPAARMASRSAENKIPFTVNLRMSFSSSANLKALQTSGRGARIIHDSGFVVCSVLHTSEGISQNSELCLLGQLWKDAPWYGGHGRGAHYSSRGLELNMKSKQLKKNGTVDPFDPQVFLDTSGVARKIAEFRRGESIYSQGEPATSVMYVQKGGVKFSVVNGSGKEAVVAMFGPSDFFGEGCMAGQTVRMGTATAITPTTVLVIDKNELLRVLHAQHELSDHFIRYMLGHNIKVEEDLIDQLFNSSEKRLARTLLLLARYGKQDQPDRILPKVSQETLASMIGTTRSRVNFFMNKFRKLGFIEYNGKIKVNKSLLTVVLHE